MAVRHDSMWIWLQFQPRPRLGMQMLMVASCVTMLLLMLHVTNLQESVWQARFLTQGRKLSSHQSQSSTTSNTSPDKCQCQPSHIKGKSQKLPNLPGTEFYIRLLNANLSINDDSFDRQINETELRILMRVMDAFLDKCEQHSIEVMLNGGSLLGSYRHHGFIQWDDDIDLLLNDSDRGRLEAVFVSNSSTGLQLTKTANNWKIWNATACLHWHNGWCWPFLDLSFYRLHGDSIYSTVPVERNLSYPVRVTFPLHPRPFMGRWVCAPRDTLRFLIGEYGSSEDCVSLHYSHRFESVLMVGPRTVRPCAAFADVHPHVIRVPDPSGGDGILEVMKLPGGWPAYSVPVKEPSNAYNHDYSIRPIEP